MNLLVSDYDNTYELHYPNYDCLNIFKMNKVAIDKFMEKGNKFCLSTGRSFVAIKKTIDEKNIKFDYLSANNGAELYDKNLNLLYFKSLEKDSIRRIKKLEEITNIYYRTAYNSNHIISINIYFDENEYNKFLKIKEYLENNVSECYMEFKFPRIKILNNISNKNDIISIIQERENISEINTYTIGDDYNDEKMILNHDGYTLESANPKIKKITKNIVTNLSDLVYKIY